MVGVVYTILRDDLRVAPAYLLLVLTVVLVVVSFYAHLRGRYRLSRLLGLVLVSLATVAVGSSIFLLVALLPTEQTPLTVLSDAGLIWTANVATFAVWYWEIDDGGPGRRPRDSHKGQDLQFPQDQDGSSGWSPDFTDYLFLAFNQSTAFGPTDTSIMSKRVKILSMIQAVFALIIIAVVVARATAQ
ncbi:MAG: DUF1345 domain-containing protein [Actinomycetota bacterium]|nr:DUF1345 domain-containing protein [Actinomycetota bacterium]